MGDEAAIVARIEEHLAAGADHVCLQPVTAVRPLTDGPDHAALDMLRQLAPALHDAGLLHDLAPAPAVPAARLGRRGRHRI